MKNILVGFFFIFFMSSCNNTIIYNAIENRKHTEIFDRNFINQFPSKVECNNYRIRSSQDSKKNDVGLELYVYGVSKEIILEETDKARKLAIATYKSIDKCLLIINRFETIDTYENRKDVEITDTSKINHDCYNNKYPISNFINYSNPNKNNDLKLDNGFNIYVLEAKPGNHFNQFNLIPNSQMPINWKNGYSKGIAINESKKTIIYFSTIW